MTDDIERLRLRQPSLRAGRREPDEEGSPAFVGQVTTASPRVGTFILVQPVSVMGAETEGSAGTFANVGPTIAVYLLGPAAPTTGDYLVCRFVDSRWVAERTSPGSGGGTTATIPSCYCDPIPASLAMTSASETCNFGMFQSCSISYQAVPAWAYTLGIGTGNAFLSDQSFPDALAGGALFYYLLTCSYNQFNLSRIYETSPYGSPYRDGILYSWLISGPGNSCHPFDLTNGNAYTGSDPTCGVTITG